MKSFIVLLFLIIITNCTTHHQAYLNVQEGWTQSMVAERFGEPKEKYFDESYEYWVYESKTRKPEKRKWLIKYAFAGNEVAKILTEKIPRPDEIEAIKQEAARKLLKSPPQPKPAEDSGNFKEL